jgi:hypothetical protein
VSETAKRENEEAFNAWAEEKAWKCGFCGKQIRAADKDAFRAEQLCSKHYRELHFKED